MDADCNDDDPTILAGATDAPSDDVDADCAGGFDNDADGDTFDDAAHEGDDCNDTAPAVHPGTDEVCDGLDDDCDGTTAGVPPSRS